MSMTTLVILQFVGIFAAYTGLTVLLPAVMFRRVLRGRRLSEQFLMCYTFGNFYIINIVFAVQLLHSDTCAAYCGSECADLEQGEPDFSEKTYHKECRSLQKTSPGQHGNKRSLLQSMAKVHQNAEICNLFLLSRSGM